MQVEDSACEKFEGMIDLCPDVKIVGVAHGQAGSPTFPAPA